MILGLALATVFAVATYATETENFGIKVLPTPGNMKVDGRIDDWDLSGGIFACGDAEVLREKVATWVHLMYDKENLYVLSRWIDETPRNNPGSTAGDMGFAGDCLQVRIAMNMGEPEERFSQVSAWYGSKDEKHVVDIDFIRYGGGKSQGKYRDAREHGAKQAFSVDEDGKGYVQELSLPWKMLTRDQRPREAGDSFVVTVEPNFTAGAYGRITVKDIFRPGVTIDRVFTFFGHPCWGEARILGRGRVKPQPVRLADAREFEVRMEEGVPVVDWTGLIQSKKLLGHKVIPFTMPDDGYVSMHIRNSGGEVVRQLLTCAFRAKGEHVTRWDGLTTKFLFQSRERQDLGEPLPPGKYSWSGIYHKGIGLRWRGWASNGGVVPWDSADGKGNWGGDHGVPASVATDGERVYLGWSGAEAGKALVAVDLAGSTQWLHKRGGFGGVSYSATDNGIVYCVAQKSSVFRLDAARGVYSSWEGREVADIDVKTLGLPKSISGLSARDGKLYVSFTSENLLAVLDGKTGALVRKLKVATPAYSLPTRDDLLYVSSANSVLALDPQTGATEPFITGIPGASGLAVDAAGNIYVASSETCQVHVYSAEGEKKTRIGRSGGRARVGMFDPSGMLNPGGIVVDPEGKLWVMEQADFPKRISVWDTGTGKFVKQFFGPTHYGASGGAISARDPDLMIGDGVEWQLDPETGRAKCVATIRQDISTFTRFCYSPKGDEYVAFLRGGVEVYERLGAGKYRLRASIKGGKEGTVFWSDENGDQKVQDHETYRAEQNLVLAGYFGWSFSMNTDFTLYPNGGYQVKLSGYTKCNAPKWDVAGMKKMPPLSAALSSLDNKLVASQNGNSFMKCYETDTGKLLWSYPNGFFGVHGSHKAPPPVEGMLRGVFGFVGSAKVDGVAGDIWAMNSNVGEWHVINGEGFYLTRLFQGNPLNVQFPERATPGAMVDNIPPGLGGEDFGGSMVQGEDGKVYIQAGKTALWNLEVVGLDTVKRLGSGSVTIEPGDLATAQGFLDRYNQQSVGTRNMEVVKMTPTFTGDIIKDFNVKTPASFQKLPSSAVKVAAAWDDDMLYLGYDVNDTSPWVNKAKTVDNMYASGDTVDFQLGIDADAEKHDNAILGDLRLSIGTFDGKPAAVIYRRKAGYKKNRKVYNSGVFKNFVMESVLVVEGAEIKVTKRNRGYVLEAAIPLAALGFKPEDELALRGDFGVTHGDPGGNDTVLRSYWNNQATGIVNDEVDELRMLPANWGQLVFRE